MAQSSPGIADGYGTGSMYLNVTASRSGNTITVNWNVSATWAANNYRTANTLAITIYSASRYSGTINIWGDGSVYNTNNNPSGSFTISSSAAVTINFSISCNWLGQNTTGTRSASGSVSVSAATVTTYNVTLNPNNGYFRSSQNTSLINTATTYTVTSGSNIISIVGWRDGYLCTGWYTAASGGSLVVENGGNLMSIKQTWDLYPHWSKYHVTELYDSWVKTNDTWRMGLAYIRTDLYTFPISTAWTKDGLNYTIETDSTMGSCLKVTPDTSTGSSQRIYYPVSQWNADQIYEVSFYAKASSNGLTCNMSRSLDNFTPTFTLTTNWAKYTGTIKSTMTATTGTLSFQMTSTSGTIYITDIKLDTWRPASNVCVKDSGTWKQVI